MKKELTSSWSVLSALDLTAAGERLDFDLVVVKVVEVLSIGRLARGAWAPVLFLACCLVLAMPKPCRQRHRSFKDRE
jgi:hypothetical protein